MSRLAGGFAAQLSGLDNHSRKKVTIILNVRIKLPSRCCDITRLPRLVVERGRKRAKDTLLLAGDSTEAKTRI